MTNKIPLKKAAMISAFVAAGAVVVYLMATPPRSDSPTSSREMGATLTVPSLDGKMISLSDYKGKVVLVDFWATWCDPCKEEIPDLVKLYEKRKGNGFVVLGVSMDEEGAKAVTRFMKKQPISYPIALNGGERPPKGWLVPGLPTAYMIDRKGQIVKQWFGSKDMPEVEAVAAAALAQK